MDIVLIFQLVAAIVIALIVAYNLLHYTLFLLVTQPKDASKTGHQLNQFEQRQLVEWTPQPNDFLKHDDEKRTYDDVFGTYRRAGELQHVCVPPSDILLAAQRVILQLFRHLSNELKASLVFLGIAEAREAIADDTQLSRRLDQMALPRWKADDEFQSLVVAILRSLPLLRPSVLSVQSLRTLARATDGITAKVFSMLNELSVEAVRSRKEQITDEDVESWKPALEREAVFA